MIKKILPVLAITSIMFATSCSNEDLGNSNEGTNSTVTFTTQLSNGLQTRSFADGTTAKTLDYAVYEVKDNDWNLLSDLGGTDVEINMTKTISLNLVNGKTYAVIFWADAQQSIYTFDATAKKVTANYTDAKSSEEAYDAFYAVEEFKVDGTNLNRTVNLKRPFAQLNIGTSDLTAAKAAGIDVTKAGVTVKTYNTLNFVDGTVDGEKEVTFAAAELPTEDFPVASSGCKYLAMNYLLMPTDKKADNTVTVSYDGATDDRVFQNIPLQRNYRTNIFGSLLTSSNNFTVTINPEFNEPDHGLNVWDGSIKEVQEVNGVYEIKEGSELAWIAQQTAGDNQFKGKTIKLMNDIDLNNRAWTPIGENSINNHPGKAFKGTFDGNGKTIYNLNVESTVAVNAAAGLFGTVYGATIKDVTIKNAIVKSTHYAGAIAAYTSNDVATTIEGCTVDGVEITSTAELVGGKYDNGDKVGGIMGYMGLGYAKSNTVKNTTVKAYRDFGGVIGCADGNSTQKSEISDNKIENVTLIVDKTHNYNGYTTQAQHNVASFVGRTLTLSDGTKSVIETGNTGEAIIKY